MHSPFRCYNSSPEVIRLTVIMYVRYPLSLRQVEDLLHERGIDLCHETYGFGGTASARCSQQGSENGEFETSYSQIGNGILTRCS